MAALNSPLLLLLATIALFLHTTTAANVLASPPPKYGAYVPIPVDDYVIELAKFAVEEHNKQTKDNLIYSKTLSAEKQLVNGNNYRLVISAYRGRATPRNYQAVVYVPFSGPKSLTSFKERPLFGGFIPIKNAQNNTMVQKLGSFAVQEYNANFNIGRNLTFSVVELAEYQIVSGTNYYLYLYAIEKVLSTERRAAFDVYVYKALSGVKTLTSFKRHLLKAR